MSWESSRYNRALREYAVRMAEKQHLIHREGYCDYCGHKEYVFYAPTDWYFYCAKHALSIPGIDGLSRRGLVMLAPNPNLTLRCHVCGRTELVMYAVRYQWLCFKCAWYRVGKARRALKVEGSKVV